jgi:hypothetical protein
MSAIILCDLCKAEINGLATQVALVRAVAGASFQGKPYFAPREDNAQMQLTCIRCSRWIDDAILRLKGSFETE